jgi:hypothetical protein
LLYGTITAMDGRDLDFWESLAERRIREAAEQGEFDDLPGSSKPLSGLDGTYDPHWWVKEWLRRTSLENTATELIRTVRFELPRLKATSHSPRTKERVAELNAVIEELNRSLGSADRIDLIEI